MIDDYSNPLTEETTPIVGATEPAATPLLDDPPEYEDRLTEAKLTDGATLFLGNKLATWVQPDSGDDGGYWDTSDLELAPPADRILARLAAIEAALGIDPNAP